MTMKTNRVEHDQPQDAKGSRSRRGFGVEAALAHDIVRELAPAAERAGYRTFWVNDEADGDGLGTLREAAAVTTTIRLGVGAIPLDRQRPEQIASRVKELALPVERLVVGVGSGHPAGGLERVRNGVAALRDAIDATLVVAAIGPRMLALGGEIADGVLLDWPAPRYIVDAAEIVGRGAAGIQRPRPWIGGYVFTAVGSPGIAQLRREAEHYAAIPSYAAHFARMGVGPMECVAQGEDAAALRGGLAPFDAVLDETVVRAVVAGAAATVLGYLEILHAAEPGTGAGLRPWQSTALRNRRRWGQTQHARSERA
jgi:alkanesulfonate monooxygenase SsuD/methylene tetrahydromethanopterin reductase-like flavin-dependent oxidoreductase (luciferase family)